MSAATFGPDGTLCTVDCYGRLRRSKLGGLHMFG